MKKTCKIMILMIITFSCNTVTIDYKTEELKLLATIDNWNKAWDEKNIKLAIKDYAENTDWTNAFGDRVTSKKDLKELLEIIFNLDFVMAAKQNYLANDITFLNENIAIMRSQNRREGQKWSDGADVGIRDIAHLRVYNKDKDGSWKIVSHMISQSHQKK